MWNQVLFHFSRILLCRFQIFVVFLSMEYLSSVGFLQESHPSPVGSPEKQSLRRKWEMIVLRDTQGVLGNHPCQELEAAGLDTEGGENTMPVSRFYWPFGQFSLEWSDYSIILPISFSSFLICSAFLLLFIFCTLILVNSMY